MYYQLAAITLLVGALGVDGAPPRLVPRQNSNASGCLYGSDFPAESEWLPFETLFDNWTPTFTAQGDTAGEVATMKKALQLYAGEGNFNPTFATAIIIQETFGNTARACGDGGASCGVMQVKGGPSSCVGQAHPCPDDTISNMIQCGTVGCAGATGTNIKACRQSSWGATARCYNTGSVPDPSNLWSAPWGTPAYVNIIGNILTGGVASTTARDQLMADCTPRS
ncbi:Uu.00g112810.m01.CDS01 [Anthostomella pinea]|uniref:Uu.00g112810.m01.CDS01 n=1 Tax=Anthostomella pinea TaxID=933095 RepID=A0AAI8YGM2_9PEZI|nr:Uu.00g112810.m01.CDS01 [Anthostomella pinea]